MKIAIYGQYYQNSTEPIIIYLFFLTKNNVDLVIEATFLELLYIEKKISQKEDFLPAHGSWIVVLTY
jgi:NAD+ kinase